MMMKTSDEKEPIEETMCFAWAEIEASSPAGKYARKHLNQKHSLFVRVAGWDCELRPIRPSHKCDRDGCRRPHGA